MKPTPRAPFDPTFVIGIVVAAICILGGLILEKGEVKDVTQVTAALIVFGGTAGAVVISTPKSTLRSAFRRVPLLLRSTSLQPAAVIEQIVSFSHVARQRGTAQLEDMVDEIQHPFFQKALRLLVDGFTSSEIRLLMETEIDLAEHRADADARVFDSAGGYAPTIGIIGAVLGLIQVMKHLDQMQEVGRGIAVAFVATVYGVAAANLLFLPIGSKIRAQSRAESKIYEMILEGVTAIQEGLNPRVVRQMLEPYAAGASKTAKAEAGTEAAAPALAESRRVM
jgi:chemotaxis protein MotA